MSGSTEREWRVVSDVHDRDWVPDVARHARDHDHALEIAGFMLKTPELYRNPRIQSRPAIGWDDEDHGCTGLTARWCPIHGTCACPMADEGEYDHPDLFEDEACPLHSSRSDHPIAYEPRADWRCEGDPIECGWEARLGETEELLEQAMAVLDRIPVLDDPGLGRVIEQAMVLHERWEKLRALL